MARGRFQPPSLTCGVVGGAEFISGVVPSLSPEAYDPALATEEFERAQAEASEVEGSRQINELNQLLQLDIGNIEGGMHGYSDQDYI